jgi:hypothetical protein
VEFCLRAAAAAFSASSAASIDDGISDEEVASEDEVREFSCPPPSIGWAPSTLRGGERRARGGCHRGVRQQRLRPQSAGEARSRRVSPRGSEGTSRCWKDRAYRIRGGRGGGGPGEDARNPADISDGADCYVCVALDYIHSSSAGVSQCVELLRSFDVFIQAWHHRYASGYLFLPRKTNVFS